MEMDAKRATAYSIAFSSNAPTQSLEVSVDIESMKDQLAKDHPNGNVVKQLWSGVETAVTADEFLGVVQSASHWIHRLFE